MALTSPLRSRDVVLAAVAAFVAWGWATFYVPQLRYLPQAFLAGALLALLGVIWVFISTAQPREQEKDIYPQAHVLFIEPQAWPVETKVFRRRLQYTQKDLYPQSMEVSQAADKLITRLEHKYVSSWYGAISQRPTFRNEVDRAIRAAIGNILGQIQDLDFVGVGVARLVPIVTQHLSGASEAERLVRGRKLTRNVTETEELDTAIAAKYRNGKLHVAASLAYADPTAVQQQHLRSVVTRLLPKVLPPDMTTSPAVNVIVREIVACAVLLPLLQLLADPDTWNRLLEGYGRTLLQERKTVRRLRAALDEHAPQSPRSARAAAPFPKLSSDDTERRFERFIRAIRQCNNLSDARRFRSEVASQLVRESAVENQDPLYLRRLEMGKRILDHRIAQLGAGGTAQTKNWPPFSKRPEPGPGSRSRLERMTLREVLYSATGLSYFMEYMDRQRLMRLVQFWIVVDGFRNPLEEDNDENAAYSTLKRSWHDADRADIAQINDGYLTQPEINVTPERLIAVKDFLKAGPTASDAQYHAARQAILQTQTAVYHAMQDHHFRNFQKSDLWFKLVASDEISSAPSVAPDSRVQAEQTAHEQALKRPSKPTRATTAVQKVKAGEIRRAASSSSDLKSLFKHPDEPPPRRSLDTGALRAPLFDDDMDSETMTRSTASIESDRESVEVFTNGADNSHVVDAMQAALNDIMEEQPDRDSLFSEQKDSGLKIPQEHDPLRGSMELPRSASPFVAGRKGKPSIASLGLVGDPARRSFLDENIFGDEEKFLEDEREDSDVTDKVDEDEIHEAAPGDLGLTEAIDALTLDIEKLVTQESIIDSLTKKAELTNNTAELRILRKSKASIQREINRKELQRQQYIVQESDNSLYGRATVSIQQIMVGQEEDGREFAMYIIEVCRAAGEQMPAATWVVARRYSEFHQLYKRLKARYPAIRNLEFPRRQVVLKLQRDFLQRRRALLERWLQELLKVPAICRSRELRAFLSQQSLPASTASPASSQVDARDFVTRIYNSVTDGMEDFLGNIPVLDQLSAAGQNLISAAATQLNASAATATAATAAATNTVLTPAEAEAEAELRAFEAQRRDQLNEPFVKPICDLFLELAALNRDDAAAATGTWLRGRAVVLVLHQLLGGTVERRVRDAARALLAADALVRYIDLAAAALFLADDPAFAPGVPPAPGDRTKDRTQAQKARSRQEAGIVLASLVPELLGSVVGRHNAQQAARRLLATLNNKRLNAHLVFTLLDEIVDVVWGAGV